MRWYWTMAEIQPFAEELGVSASGPKAALIERVAAKLGGRQVPVSTNRKPKPVVDAIVDPTQATVIPKGQRSTEPLRQFFQTEIGPAFKFNGHMRAFLLEGDATLGEAIDHWYQTVGTPLPKQSESLEFNRFTKEWHVANPGGTAKQCRQAWADFRARPRS